MQCPRARYPGPLKIHRSNGKQIYDSNNNYYYYEWKKCIIIRWNINDRENKNIMHNFRRNSIYTQCTHKHTYTLYVYEYSNIILAKGTYAERNLPYMYLFSNSYFEFSFFLSLNIILMNIAYIYIYRYTWLYQNIFAIIINCIILFGVLILHRWLRCGVKLFINIHIYIQI